MAATKILFTLVIGYALGGPIEDAWRDRMKDKFFATDKNKDGFCTLEEVLLDNSQIDTNGDGFIEFAEERAAFHFREGEDEPPFNQAVVMMALIKNEIMCLANGSMLLPTSWNFRDTPGMDANGDDLLSEEEFYSYSLKVFVNNLKGQAYKCGAD